MKTYAQNLKLKNKMIIKNYKKFILNEALAIRKKDTIDPIINLYLNNKDINKDISEIINKDAEERILKEPSLDKESAYKKSFQSYIIKILKTLSLRIKKDGQILIDISLELFNELAPIFIDLNMKESFSIEDLTSIYSALEGLQFDKKYIDTFLILKNYSNDILSKKELINLLVNFKDLFVSGKELNININNKSIPLVNYIGKDEPVWWPYNNAPLEEPLEEWGLIKFIGNIKNFEGDRRDMSEIISDRIRDVKSMGSIVYFTNNIIPEKFIVANKESPDYGREIDLKKIIYTQNDEGAKEKIQFLSPLVQQAEKSVRDIIYNKIRTKRNVKQILDFVEISLTTGVPSDMSPIITRIEEINRKIGKSNGVDIIYESEDYTTIIVEVKTYQANSMLNGRKPKGELTLSQHCIANNSSNWESYVGSDGPNYNNRKYTLQFYIYDLNQRGSNQWVIGISINKDNISACHTYSDGAFMHLINDHLKEENIPFFQILNKVDPNDEGTKYEGMTYLEKQLSIKQKQIELNKKISSGDISIAEIEEALAEGANINAYNGLLIKKSIDNFERIKFLVSKGAAVQYLFDEVDKIINSKNFELLKFLINNGLDLSSYKISYDVVKNYDIFKIITDSWKHGFSEENIPTDVFEKITDLRIIFLLHKNGYNFKKAIGFDTPGSERTAKFMENNQDNYPVIKFLFDIILPKYSSNKSYHIFPINIDVYHLFILNGYPLNYLDSICLYNLVKAYNINNTNNKFKDNLDNILNSFITEKITYKESCPTCKGYGVIEENLCPTCEGTGLSDKLNTYKSSLDTEGNLCHSTPYSKFLKNPYFSEKFFNVLVKLKTVGVNVDLDYFDEYLDLLDEDDILKKKDILIKVFSLYSDDLQSGDWKELLLRLQKLGLV